MTKLIAITGGIGSGKSTFSNEILKKGYKLLDSDKQVDLIYKKPTKKFLNFLKKIHLKKSIHRGKINKKYIAKVVFSNHNIRKRLEKYIFTLVRRDRDLFIKKEKKRKTQYIFFDIPLLFENKLHKNYDIVISIVSKKSERLKRLKKSKKMTKAMFDNIIKSQTTDVIRKKNSNIIINNNQNLKIYLNKINDVINKIVL